MSAGSGLVEIWSGMRLLIGAAQVEYCWWGMSESYSTDTGPDENNHTKCDEPATS